MGHLLHTNSVMNSFRHTERNEKFKVISAQERHEYHDKVRPGKKKVVIIRQVAGQGAMYDTWMFPDEPSGVEGGRSIIDMAICRL